MQSRQQKKDFAKTLYLSEKGITQKEIAARVGVTEATVSKWVREEQWERLKTSLLGGREDLLGWLHQQLNAIREAVEARDDANYVTSKEADTITKLTNAIKKLETETNITHKVEVGRQFLTWLRETDPDRAVEFLPLYDAFIKEALR
ncbi:helix-turn-helix domain-containing protein [uncultured Rikenella sp.]|uniref:helix-turn-helix domain-containing protein n=1 Tax=uncultured Rikenella sp. TaxID=368003 RepID=UPI0025DD54F8|nr:helix-turn-helix domain-containing protein [uncultured Rikenella sp.]